MRPRISLPLVVLALAASPRLAAAQEIQLTGPLAGAPALPGRPWFRDRLASVSPALMVGFARGEHPTPIFGGEVAAYPCSWLGVAAWGGGAPIHHRADTTRLHWIASPEVVLVPVIAKVALFDHLVFPIDLRARLGGAWMGVERDGARGTSIALTAGGGLTISLTRRISLGFDYRALLDQPTRHTLALSLAIIAKRDPEAD